MSDLLVQQGELQAQAGQLRARAGELESLLQQMNSQISGLLGDWRGVAQQRFSSLWDEYRRGADEIHQALLGIQQLLDQAGQTFQDTENAVAGSFRS